jgi:hypothetical protein
MYFVKLSFLAICCYISRRMLIELNFIILYIESTTTYKVGVTTGKDFGSGTNANVYIIIFGKMNNTGFIDFLYKIKNE